MYLAINEEIEIVMPEIIICDTIPQHLRELAMVLRAEDENEILAFGITPEKALWRSYKGAILRKTAFIDGKIAAIWGVGGSFMGHTGRPWLLTSPEVKKISPLKFTRIYQQEVKRMLELFPKLTNIVDANYSAAIRLLDIVGFELGEPEPLGNQGKLFVKFKKGVMA